MTKSFVLNSFSRIRKQEFPEIINGTITIVAKHDPSSLLIDKMFNRLLALQKQLPLLSEKRSSHPLTIVLKNQRFKRKKLIQAIVLQVQAKEKAALASQSGSVASIMPLIQIHFANLARANQKVVYQEVNDFFCKVQADGELTQAAQDLGINVYIDELQTLQQSIAETLTARIEDQYPNRSVDKKQIKANIIETFQQLLSFIQLAAVEDYEKKYSALINELNEFLAPYQALVKRRISLSKKAATKTTTVAPSLTTNATANWFGQGLKPDDVLKISPVFSCLRGFFMLVLWLKVLVHKNNASAPQLGHPLR